MRRSAPERTEGARERAGRVQEKIACVEERARESSAAQPRSAPQRGALRMSGGAARICVAVVHSGWAGSTCAEAQRLNIRSSILVGFYVDAWKQFFEQQVHVCRARLTRACLSAEVAEQMIKRELTQRGTVTSLGKRFSDSAGKSNARAAEGKAHPMQAYSTETDQRACLPLLMITFTRAICSRWEAQHACPPADASGPLPDSHMHARITADELSFSVTMNNVQFKQPGRMAKSRF
jgi:hypothetical protein